jgi:hypothetical protein
MPNTGINKFYAERRHDMEDSNDIAHITTYKMTDTAQIVLHQRKKKREESTNRMTLIILIFTVFLSTLTLIFVFAGFKIIPIKEILINLL